MSVYEIIAIIISALAADHAAFPNLPLVAAKAELSYNRSVHAQLVEKRGILYFEVQVTRKDQGGYTESAATRRAEYGEIQWGILTEMLRDLAGPWTR